MNHGYNRGTAKDSEGTARGSETPMFNVVHANDTGEERHHFSTSVIGHDAVWPKPSGNHATDVSGINNTKCLMGR